MKLKTSTTTARMETEELRKEAKTPLKKTIWVGDSLERLREFPEDVKDEFGQGIYEAQRGLFPDNAKPLTDIGHGVLELADDHDKDTYRCVYIAKLKKAVYILHSFKKKSKSGKSIPRDDLEKIKSRYKRALQLDSD